MNLSLILTKIHTKLPTASLLKLQRTPAPIPGFLLMTHYLLSRIRSNDSNPDRQHGNAQATGPHQRFAKHEQSKNGTSEDGASDDYWDALRCIHAHARDAKAQHLGRAHGESGHTRPEYSCSVAR